MQPTLGDVLADIGPLGVARVRAGLSALIEGHAHVSTGDRGTRRRALLSLLRLGAVHPVQLAWRVDVAQAQPCASLPGTGGDR